MSGDPVEEGGQAVRTGFVQAMQTAAMTMNLVQRRGAESRSRAEFESRTDDAEQRRQQNVEVHELKVDGYHSRASNEGELHQLEKHFKTRQIERAEELHNLERQIKKRVLERGDADLDRRAADSSAERGNKDDIHQLRRQELLNRAGWEKERHELDVEYKQLLIDIRRRAAGFTETLDVQDRDHGAAMRAAAAYAAANSTADLSDQHRSHADAFAERFTEDTDLKADDLLDAGVEDPVAESAMTPAVFRATNGLAQELSLHIFVDHRAEQDSNVPEPASTDGTAIEAAIDMSNVMDVEVIDVEVVDGYGEDTGPTAMTPLPPDVGIEP